MPSTRCGFSASRSSMASGVPAARAASRSSALAARISCARASTASAAACSARSLVAVLSVPSVRAATARPARGVVDLLRAGQASAGACTLIRPAYRTCPRHRGCRPAHGGLRVDGLAARVCVVGSVNPDLVVHRRRACRGPARRCWPRRCRRRPGGKGGNQAVAAARAGAAVHLVAALGDGRRGRAAARPSARQRRRTRRRGDACPGPAASAAIVVDAAAENTIVVAPGANAHLSDDARRRPGRRSPTADVVLMQLEIPIETALAAARVGARRGRRRSWSTRHRRAPTRRPARAGRVADVVVVNEAEVAANGTGRCRIW